MLDIPDHMRTRPAAELGVSLQRPDLLTRARLLSSALFKAAPQGDADGRITDAAWVAMTESDLAMSVFPESLGGEGLLDAEAADLLVGILRLIGAGDLSMARIFEGHVNAVALVIRYGTHRQCADLAAAVRSGALSAVWNAEGRRPLSGTLQREAWYLDGEKILASGAGFITHPIVTPSTAEGVVMLIPPLAPGERADASRWTPQGMRATATGTMDLTGLVVPRTAQIGHPGDYLRQPHFSGGAWRFCAVHLGAAERLLDLFRAHLIARDRATDPYQRQRIATCVAATTTARFWIERAATLLATDGLEAGEAVAYVNLTRMVTERACLDVLEAVQRGMGLGAFMHPDPVERIARDLATYLRQPVPDAAMVDAARTVLSSATPVFDLWSGRA